MSLTRREMQCVELLAEGLTIAQISDRLYIAISTVKLHLRNAAEDLGIAGSKQTAIVAAAFRAGILS